MSPFPLFSLPLVPIGNIMELCTPIVLMELSLTSKKAAKTVKLGGAKNLKLSLKFDEQVLEITSKKEPLPYRILIQKKAFENQNMIGSRFVKGLHAEVYEGYVENFMPTRWDNPVVAMETLAFYLADVFGCTIDNLKACSLSTVAFLRIIQSIVNRQNELESLDIRKMNLDEGQIEEVLRRLNITRTLRMDTELSPQFPVALFQNTYSIVFEKSSWFSGDILVQMNCTNIMLSDSELSNQDLEHFLNRWKRGEFPNLKSMYIRSLYFDDEAPIFEMFPPVEKREIPEKFRKIFSDFAYGVPVRRDDGQIATISFFGDLFEFLVWDFSIDFPEFE